MEDYYGMPPTSDVVSQKSKDSIESNVFESWVRVAGNEELVIKARAIADTGCHDNWISMDVLERAKMNDQIRSLPRALRFEGFASLVEARSEVELTIIAANTSFSRRIWFYVHDDPPFDMVLGREYLKKNMFAFYKPALMLRKPRRSKGTCYPRFVNDVSSC